VTRLPVALSGAAERDIDEAVAYYVGEGAYAAAHRLVDELEAAVGLISRHPEAGSPRYAQELGLPGLRYWLLAGYPYLVFYFEHGDRVEVWRVLHAERDIPEWLRT